VGVCRASLAEAEAAPGPKRQALARSSRRAGWDSLGSSHGCTVEGSSAALPTLPDLSSSLSTVVPRRNHRASAARPGPAPSRTRRDRHYRGLHRRHLHRGQKGGSAVGKTKRGKGTKIMAIADRSGLPVSAWITSASPAEVTLVEDTLDHGFLPEDPERLIGDKAYDSDGLDQRLWEERGVEMISPNRSNRKRVTQDGRPLRRYVRRWKVERLFAWMHNFRRLVIRYERHPENFQGFVHLGCLCILLRHL